MKQTSNKTIIDLLENGIITKRCLDQLEKSKEHWRNIPQAELKNTVKQQMDEILNRPFESDNPYTQLFPPQTRHS